MYWIVLIGLLLAGAWKGGIVGEADREVLGRFWQYAEERELAGLPAGERVVAAGRFFEGMPYEGGTLGNTPEERVVVNLRAFDCVTFVENATGTGRRGIMLRGCIILRIGWQRWCGRGYWRM